MRQTPEKSRLIGTSSGLALQTSCSSDWTIRCSYRNMLGKELLVLCGASSLPIYMCLLLVCKICDFVSPRSSLKAVRLLKLRQDELDLIQKPWYAVSKISSGIYSLLQEEFAFCRKQFDSNAQKGGAGGMLAVLQELWFIDHGPKNSCLNGFALHPAVFAPRQHQETCPDPGMSKRHKLIGRCSARCSEKAQDYPSNT